MGSDGVITELVADHDGHDRVVMGFERFFERRVIVIRIKFRNNILEWIFTATENKTGFSAKRSAWPIERVACASRASVIRIPRHGLLYGVKFTPKLIDELLLLLDCHIPLGDFPTLCFAHGAIRSHGCDL